MVRRLSLMSLKEIREMKLLMLQGQMDQMSKEANMLQIVEDSGEEAGIPVEVAVQNAEVSVVETAEVSVVVVEVDQDRMMAILITCQVHVDAEEVVVEEDPFIKTETTTKGHHVVDEADSSI